LTELTIIEKLKELGFNTYEARVYVALLKQHPSTGYEISKESGVPQARAYDTLKALQTANVVVADNNGRPVTYTPIPPEELLDRWERSYSGSIRYLRDALPSVARETVEPVTIVRGKEVIYQQALDMIRHAKHTVFIELWQEDSEVLYPMLKEAQARGVILRIVGYDNCQMEGIHVYQHAWSKNIETGVGGRWLAVAVDDREGVVGRISREERFPQALVTRNLSIITLIKELVIHDIFLLEVEHSLPEEMERLYGKHLTQLRTKILSDTMVHLPA
jgi:HTH-type transcriptional regulator, sugar sensing transcriptional regulator